MLRERIVTFHGLGTPHAGVPAEEIPYWLSSGAFDALLQRCQIARNQRGIETVLTFDDGNSTDATIALPALTKYGFKAIFFLCAARIGTPHFVDRAALADLLSAGMEIGSHGMHHVSWRNLDPASQAIEYDGACSRIEDVCGRRVTKAAMPFGLYDRRVLSNLRSRHFEHVYTCDRGIADAGAWLKTRTTMDVKTPATTLDRLFSEVAPPTLALRSKAAVLYKSLR